MLDPIPSQLLVLSNGHGEDQVAIRIVKALQKRPQPPEIKALPIVGEGHAYQRQGIQRLDAFQVMPSGGFIYMDSRQTLRDLQGGLWQLTLRQLREVRKWAQQGGKILAVGDIVPLLFAWWSGAPYAFVGTAKSDYYLRDDGGKPLPNVGHPWWLSPSDYLPWERWLMQKDRCRGVFPRDSLTAETLQQWPIPVFNEGNPMMDNLQPTGQLNLSPLTDQEQQTILLLPGSRPPEAYENFERILAAVSYLRPSNQLFLAAIAPGLDRAKLTTKLEKYGWHFVSDQLWAQEEAALILTEHFNDCLARATVAIATAGTATEQCVGLGLPVITLPGQGPQFTAAFAEAQSRLLGDSIYNLEHPQQVPHTLQEINRRDRQRWQANGIKRMGHSGAAQRIATILAQELLA